MAIAPELALRPLDGDRRQRELSGFADAGARGGSRLAAFLRGGAPQDCFACVFDLSPFLRDVARAATGHSRRAFPEQTVEEQAEGHRQANRPRRGGRSVSEST